MRDGPSIVRIAALIGEQARAEVLTVLLADRALTASELANVAGVGKSTISTHLAQLVDARLVVVERQGRHRYFRLADRDVAVVLESLMGVAFRTGAVRVRASPREPALRRARLCYDHLAGELGVYAYEALLLRGVLRLDREGLCLGRAGSRWFREFGVDVVALAAGKRTFCRSCLDWSERRSHLAGALGAALLERLRALGWARCASNSRVVTFSAGCERAFRSALAQGP